MKRTEWGQAVIETLLVSLILLVPLMWMLGVLSDLQRGALGTTAAAREAGFDAASSSEPSTASAAVERAVHQAFVDEGLDPTQALVSWASTPGFPRGGTVKVSVSYPVTIAQFPFIGRASGPSITIKSIELTRIDPYRSRP